MSVVVAQVCCRQTDGTSFSSEPEETHTSTLLPPSLSPSLSHNLLFLDSAAVLFKGALLTGDTFKTIVK